MDVLLRLSQDSFRIGEIISGKIFVISDANERESESVKVELVTVSLQSIRVVCCKDVSEAVSLFDSNNKKERGKERCYFKTEIVPLSDYLPTHSGKKIKFGTKILFEMLASDGLKKSFSFPVHLIPPFSPTPIKSTVNEEDEQDPDVIVTQPSFYLSDDENQNAGIEEKTGSILKRTNPFLMSSSNNKFGRTANPEEFKEEKEYQHHNQPHSLQAPHSGDLCVDAAGPVNLPIWTNASEPIHADERIFRPFPSSRPLLAKIVDPNSGCEVVRVSIQRTSVKPGDNIFGALEFYSDSSKQVDSPSSICAQFCVSLVAAERTLQSGTNGRRGGEERIVHATDSEICLGLESSSFELHVPEHVTPGFSTSIFSLRWFLLFEFVLTPKSSLANNMGTYDNTNDRPSSGRLRWGKRNSSSSSNPDSGSNRDSSTWKAPAKMEVTTRKWETPITVYK